MEEIEYCDCLPFFRYVYDNVVSVEYPSAALLLKFLRQETESEAEFFRMLVEKDFFEACDAVGIGRNSVYYVRDLCSNVCEMMIRILSCPDARTMFEDSARVEDAAPFVRERIEDMGVRTFHVYQKLKDEYGGSVLSLYLWAIGRRPGEVKLPGLSVENSDALLDFLKNGVIEIVKSLPPHISVVSDRPESMVFNVSEMSEDAVNSYLRMISLRVRLGLPDEDFDRVCAAMDRLGRFPMFMFLSCRVSKMKKQMLTIARRTLNMVHGHSLESLSDVARSMNLSCERVRQIRARCLREIHRYPGIVCDTGLADDYVYQLRSDYDFDLIRQEEEVDFSNEFIMFCIASTNADFSLVGNVDEALSKPPRTANRLYLVPKTLHEIFRFEDFIGKVEEMIKERRVYPYREELDSFVSRLTGREMSREDLYAVVKECRQIMVKSYPDNIINNQVIFPENARKNIPDLIEDILREFNRPMAASEISEQLNNRYPDLETVPSKIGVNALRNNKIAAVSRSGTYTLIEWDQHEKRGGTIRDIALEYLNSLGQPIAPLSDICDYISKFRKNIKESSVKANLLAEATNQYSLYYKGNVSYIGLSDYDYSDEYVLVPKRQGRRSFKDSIDLLEKFINENGRFPYSSGVSGEEVRLSRFYLVAKANMRKGLLSDEDRAEFERICNSYSDFHISRDRISWDEMLERFTKHIIDYERLPFHSSREYKWYEENLNLYNDGKLDPVQVQSFSQLLKIIKRM